MWYRGSIQLSADATVTSRYLHEVDLAAAAGSVTLTLPATGPDPTYVGVTNASSVGDGSKVVLVQTAAAVEVCRLSAAGESVWLGRNPITGAWELLAHDNPSEYQWQWANAAARVASLVSAAQIGRKGYQTDIAREYQRIGAARWGELADPQLGPLKLSEGGDTNLVNALGYTGSVGIAAGTLTQRPSTSGSRGTAMLRTDITTAAGAGSQAAFRSSSVINPIPSQGFRFVTHVELSAASANVRWFAGLSATLSVANVNPNTFLNSCGIGRGNGEANLQLFHNDGAGVATQVDLGASFPAATANVAFQFQLYTVDGTSIVYQVLNLNTLAEISGTLTTDLLGNTSLLFYYLSNNTDAVANSLGIGEARMQQIVR